MCFVFYCCGSDWCSYEYQICHFMHETAYGCLATKGWWLWICLCTLYICFIWFPNNQTRQDGNCEDRRILFCRWSDIKTFKWKTLWEENIWNWIELTQDRVLQS
jgi:hypothetical protein